MKFKVGDYVYHLSAERSGKITQVFTDENGPRYYVQHSRWEWSVPESGLLFDTPRNQQVTRPENAAESYELRKQGKRP